MIYLINRIILAIDIAAKLASEPAGYEVVTGITKALATLTNRQETTTPCHGADMTNTSRDLKSN